jgi:hypothetical protein
LSTVLLNSTLLAADAALGNVLRGDPTCGRM